ncbi:hypothetical protein ABT075_21855 [Streptomyces sp. NPDC002677]|uniref:hypothetical protein n=1 Tax=Streptomyces sp. NPDC002677 TaxID=3154774 RepID=UPI0033230CAC
MSTIHLSSFGHARGEPQPVASLADLAGTDIAPLAEEIPQYRASDQALWELAATSCEPALAARPDLLLYVSENDPDTAGSLAALAGRLGLSGVPHLALSGNDCGNLGPALSVITALLHGGGHDRVLLVLADRAVAGQRVMANGMSVFSDGATACLVTRPDDKSGPCFAVHAVSTRVHVTSGADRDTAVLSTIRLAQDSVADVLRATGHARDDHRYIVFPNYRPASQLFLTAATGFPQDRLLLGPVGDQAHCFSADLFHTLDHHADTLRPGDRLLAAVIGPHSWSTLSVERR